MIGPISYRSKTDKENDHLIWLIRSKICWLISSEGNIIFNWGNNNILVFSFAIGTIVSIEHWHSQVSFGEQLAIGSSKYLMRAMACKMLLFRGREWSNIKLINIGQTPFQIMTFLFLWIINSFHDCQDTSEVGIVDSGFTKRLDQMDELPNFVFFTWFSAFDPTFFSLKAESCDLCHIIVVVKTNFFIQSPGQSDILLPMVMTLGQDGQKI